MTNEPQPYEDPNYNDDIESADIEDNTTKVGLSQTNKVLSSIIVVIILIGISYLIFSGEEEPTKKASTENVSPLKKPRDEDGEIIVDKVPKQPEETFEPLIANIEPQYEEAVDVIPEIVIPDLPPVADIKVDIPDERSIIPTISSDKDKEVKKRQSSNRSRLDQLQGVDDEDDIIKENLEITEGRQVRSAQNYQSMMFLSGNSSFSGENSLILNDSSAETITAAKLPYPERTIAQGKLIEAVLETAINTDFDGKVRAIVSRDVYGDFGRQIFIPKGSRVIGSYAGQVTASQTRVLITWERLIRPDAVDIMIDSPAADQFGRSGVPGDVDNKYLEIFNNAILLSLLTIGSAIALEDVTDSDGITVDEDDDGSTTTSGTAVDYAASDIIDTITTTGETVLTDLLNVTPTITVPHGTRIKIFVSKDLLFPETGNENNDGLMIIE